MTDNAKIGQKTRFNQCRSVHRNITAEILDVVPLKIVVAPGQTLALTPGNVKFWLLLWGKKHTPSGVRYGTSASWRGVTTGGQRAQFPGNRITMSAPNDCGGVEKSKQCYNYFNAIHLLPKYLRFEHRGGKFASFPGRHLTSLRP